MLLKSPLRKKERHARVDGFVGLKVKGDLLFLAFVCEDRAHKKDEPVGGYAGVELQTLLCTCDGSKHGETVHARLDVRRRTVLLRQHGGCARNLVL